MSGSPLLKRSDYWMSLSNNAAKTGDVQSRLEITSRDQLRALCRQDGITESGEYSNDRLIAG
jgi:hypothetical protein